jgi:transcriptional regulator with XRE-family HTH domain
MVEHLGDFAGLGHNSISGYELGTREPPLQILLRYSEIANVHLEVLADDGLDLPEKIPSSKRHAGVKRSKKGVGRKH